MILENIYYVGQTIAVIVIIATLIALLFQTRQTNKIARYELTCAHWHSAADSNMSFFDSPEKADFMYRAFFNTAELSDSELARLGAFLSVVITQLEVANALKRNGLIDDDVYHRHEIVARYWLGSRRARTWWSVNRETYIAPFVDIMDKIAKDAEASDPRPGFPV